MDEDVLQTPTGGVPSERAMSACSPSAPTEPTTSQGAPSALTLTGQEESKDDALNVRQQFAQAFSTGDVNVLRINEENIHNYLHFAVNFLATSMAIDLVLGFFANFNQKYVLNRLRDLPCVCLPILTEYYATSNSSDDLPSTVRTKKQSNLNRKICFQTRAQPASTAHGTRQRGEGFLLLFLKRKETENVQKVLSVNVSSNFAGLPRPASVRKVTRFGRGFAVCSLNLGGIPYIFLSGGAGKHEADIRKYDVIEDKWRSSNKMPSKREFHMMAVVGRKVYIFGGLDNESVEEFDPATKKCTVICSISKRVHAAATFVCGKNIYIFGGKTDHGNRVPAVQSIDTATKSCRKLANLPVKCSECQAVAIDDKIYIASGQGHMIRFDANTGMSELCASQPCRREQFAIHVTGKSILLIGGTQHGCLDNDRDSYLYSPVTDSWEVFHVATTFPLQFSASCYVQYTEETPIIPFYPHHRFF